MLYAAWYRRIGIITIDEITELQRRNGGRMMEYWGFNVILADHHFLALIICPSMAVAHN